jgi:hypothetical protein
MPSGLYRVSTKIHCDETTRLFRCAVTHGGEEIQRPPFAPVFRNLGDEVTARPDDLAAMRRAVARLALEHHLSLCTQLGRVLESGGDPARAGEWPRRILTVGAPALAVLVAVGVGWHFWPWFGQGPASPAAATAPPQTVAESPAASATGGTPSAGGTTTVQQTGTAAPPVPPIVPRPPEGPAVTEVQVAKGRNPRPSAPRSQREAPRKPEPEVPPAVASVVESEPPAPPETTSTADRWPVVDISPSNNSMIWLEAGKQIYYADSVRLDEVASAYRDLRCFTTRAADGDTKEAISFRLVAPSEVEVLHDGRVKKPPAWLDDFAASGDSVTATDGGERISLRVFRKNFPAGLVALGTNTEARGVTRFMRRASGRGTLMYLVCVPMPPVTAPRGE